VSCNEAFCLEKIFLVIRIRKKTTNIVARMYKVCPRVISPKRILSRPILDSFFTKAVFKRPAVFKFVIRPKSAPHLKNIQVQEYYNNVGNGRCQIRGQGGCFPGSKSGIEIFFFGEPEGEISVLLYRLHPHILLLPPLHTFQAEA